MEGHVFHSGEVETRQGGSIDEDDDEDEGKEEEDERRWNQ